MYKTGGYSSFIYPTLVDPASPGDNFDEVGPTAELFLVASKSQMVPSQRFKLFNMALKIVI